MFVPRKSILGGLAFAVALMLMPGSLFAQWSPQNKHRLMHYGYAPGYYGGPALGIPPAAKGYQTTMMLQQNYRRAERAASAYVPLQRYTPEPEPASSGLAVGITPPPSKPMTVAIRGPDGKVRNFPLASPDAIQPRTIIVRPGERLSITVNGSVRVQLQKN